MRFVPATRIGSISSTPIPRRVQVSARIAAGGIAAAGAFAVLANGHAAGATTLQRGRAATAPAPPVVPATVNKYVVTKGDTLWDVAQRSGVSVDALVRANGISSSTPIQIGQHLVLPTAKTTSIPTAKVSSSGVVPTDLPSDSSRFGLQASFQSAASSYGVPLSLLKAVAWNESGWQNTVVSHTGAVGIGQLMPDTVHYVNSHLVAKPLNPATPDGNIRIAASYLHYLINLNRGDYRTALADYYQGNASVAKNGTFSDTKLYVANVLAIQKRYF